MKLFILVTCFLLSSCSHRLIVKDCGIVWKPCDESDAECLMEIGMKKTGEEVCTYH